ncbi:MAG TPA: DinB family protein [Chloroflexota bacterium]
MELNEVLIDAYGRIQRSVHTTLEGLTAEQLTACPGEQANTIAWLTWHLTRVQDHHLSDLAGKQQAWIADGWHGKFGMPADPTDTGTGYTPQQVAAVRPPDTQLLVDYHDAVHKRSVDYLRGLKPADLDRELDEPQWTPRPTVGVRLISVIGDGLQHAGQAAYVKGMLLGKRWFPA